MQSEKMIPIFIPLELLQEAGITPNSVLQGEVVDGKLVMQVADPNPDEFDCDGECDGCPFYDSENDRCPVFDDYLDFKNNEGAKGNE